MSTRISIAGAGINTILNTRNFKKEVDKVESNNRTSSRSSGGGRGSDAAEALTGGLSADEMSRNPKIVKTQEALKDNLIEMMWHVSCLDIRQLLSVVCNKIYTDSSVTSEERNLRLVALRLLGEIYVATRY